VLLHRGGGLRQHIALVESSVVSQPNSPVSTSSHTDQVLELLRKLMEYRSDEVRHRLEKVGRAASMLHMDVLLLTYHFARFRAGNMLEIGPYVGESAIAAAFGAHDSRETEDDSKHRSRRRVETLSAVEQEYHQRFAKESCAIRRSGRR